MKTAIMQPYFFPYIGYFQLINEVDKFILFDTPQFIRHGWIERNNVLKLDGDKLYIKVPLYKHNRDSTINNVKINNEINWKHKILAQLVHYKKKAPHYESTIAIINRCFKIETESITKLNFFILKELCGVLDINTPIYIWSDMNIEIDKVSASDEWALQICKAIEAEEYINPIGGELFFDKNKYKLNSIHLKFLESKPLIYKQFNNDFIPYLSIIDLLMFCSIEEIKLMMNSFILKD